MPQEVFDSYKKLWYEGEIYTLDVDQKNKDGKIMAKGKDGKKILTDKDRSCNFYFYGALIAIGVLIIGGGVGVFFYMKNKEEKLKKGQGEATKSGGEEEKE